jgi:hypothetical protein
MADVTLRFARVPTKIYPDKKEEKQLHTQRAKLIHGLVDILDLEVKDWGNTDSAKPHEDVQLIMDIAAIVVPAVASIIVAWINNRKTIKFVGVKPSDGIETKIEDSTSLEAATAAIRNAAS